MTFKDNSVSCDVFMYYGQLFVPVRTAAELMDKSIIYDDETGSARITDIYPNGQAEGVIFEAERLGQTSIKCRCTIRTMYSPIQMYGMIRGAVLMASIVMDIYMFRWRN